MVSPRSRSTGPRSATRSPHPVGQVCTTCSTRLRETTRCGCSSSPAPARTSALVLMWAAIPGIGKVIRSTGCDRSAEPARHCTPCRSRRSPGSMVSPPAQVSTWRSPATSCSPLIAAGSARSSLAADSTLTSAARSSSRESSACRRRRNSCCWPTFSTQNAPRRWASSTGSCHRASSTPSSRSSSRSSRLGHRLRSLPPRSCSTSRSPRPLKRHWRPKASARRTSSRPPTRSKR